MQTVKDHTDLYDELKVVIYTRGLNIQSLSPAQLYFVNAIEQAAFGSDLLKAYAELVDETPDISLRNLHAFCVGFGLGLSNNIPEIELSKSYH